MRSRTANRCAALGGVLALAAGCACPAATVEAAGVERPYCVRRAVTEADRARGLRGADPLAPGEGMLLVFPVEDDVCIVNGGVTFDLDVLYAGADDAVVTIERGFPAGDGVARCHPGVQRVLEVRAGELDDVALPAFLRSAD